MAKGSILHANQEGVEVLRFVGDIRYLLAPGLEDFLETVFTDPGLKGFVIDLRETLIIDSTNLGILARIAKRMQLRSAERVCIVSVREDINEVLDSLGFDEVFDIVESSKIGTNGSEELAPAAAGTAAMARTLLDAHRTLLNLNESNQALFQEVVSTLERNSAGVAKK